MDVAPASNLEVFMRQHVLVSLLLVTCASCTKPSPDAPGVGEQPDLHPERSPATQPSRPGPANSTPPSASPDDPDQLGTTRTPPAPAAAPMDEIDDAGVAPRSADAGRDR